MLHAVEQKKIYIYIFHPVVRNLKLNQHSKHFVKTANKILHTKLLLNVYMQMGTYALNYKKPTETSAGFISLSCSQLNCVLLKYC